MQKTFTTSAKPLGYYASCDICEELQILYGAHLQHLSRPLQTQLLAYLANLLANNYNALTGDDQLNRILKRCHCLPDTDLKALIEGVIAQIRCGQWEVR